MTTPFVETNALLAAMSGDRAEAEEYLRSMYRGELLALEGACYRLGEWARIMRGFRDHAKSGRESLDA